MIERVTVVSTVADEIFRLGFDHVEVEAQLYEAHVMVRDVGADRERQAVAISPARDGDNVASGERIFPTLDFRASEASRFAGGAIPSDPGSE